MRRYGALLIAVLLAGCGEGGSRQTVPAAATAAQSKSTGSVQFAINIPATTGAQAKSRKAQYVSPATKSFSIAVHGTVTNVNVTGTSAGCTSDYTQPAYTETPVNVQPRGMVLGPDGNVWFVEDAGNAIGDIAPGGAYTDHNFGYFENGIIVGPDGDLWTTSPYNQLLGHVTTAGSVGYFTGFPADIQYLAEAADGTVWGTAYTQAPLNVVYHIGSDGTFLSNDTITLGNGTMDTMPALGSDGAIYVTENNGTSGWVARIAKSGSTWSLTNEFPLRTRLRTGPTVRSGSPIPPARCTG